MTIEEKRVLVLLVEGPTDRSTLENAVRSYLSLHNKNGVICMTVYGDATIGTLKKQIKKDDLIPNIVNIINRDLKRQKLKSSDIIAIAHLIDFDACHSKKNQYLYSPNDWKFSIEKNVIYTLQQDILFSFREAKRKNIEFLISLSSIKVGYYDIPYRIFYNNVNLEHVFYGNAMINCSEDMKITLADTFDDKHNEYPEKFKKFVDNLPCYSNDYMQSWALLLSDVNTFNRESNFSILLKWIDNKFE